ncbi:hypothetical protein CYJ76_03385 [Kytococcus schroeteri]|uniref:Uncharacterized protein n=1 Tax=Kytococcus schroeteri TaxID=138300 RepID=A0A2I1PCJ8_9MICO|nr:hypothetical protein CYJ76_03385 [Kytococcus schroeteri]
MHTGAGYTGSASTNPSFRADTAYWGADADARNAGTHYTIRIGRLDLRNAAPEGATGFKIVDDPATAIIRTLNGVEGQATVTGYAVNTVQLLTAPVNTDMYIQTTIPWVEATGTGGREDGNKLASLSVPLNIQFTQGLEPIVDPTTGAACPPVTVYANYCYDGDTGYYLSATGLENGLQGFSFSEGPANTCGPLTTTSYPDIVTPNDAGWTYTASAYVEPVPADWPGAPTPGAIDGTVFTARLGRLDFSGVAPAGATGFRIRHMDDAVVRTLSGTEGTADVRGFSANDVMPIGAPSGVDAYLHTTIPYSWTSVDANRLASASIPVTIEFYNGLTLTSTDSDIWLNYCYNVGRAKAEASGLIAPFVSSASPVDPCA